MAVQVNTLFRQALRNGKVRLQKQLYYYDAWEGWNIVWSDEYNMTANFLTFPINSTPNHTRNRYPLGDKKSHGVYMVIYIPTGEIMYIGEGKVWERFNRHGNVYKSMQKFKTYKAWVKSGTRYARGGHECSQKMIAWDRSSLNLWSFKLCITESKSIAKEYEEVLKQSIKPRFNVKGFDVT